MAEPLKHHISRTTVRLVAERCAVVWPGFDAASFEEEVVAELEPLELKDRINLVADGLQHHLPAAYPQALDVVVGVAKQPLDGWAAWTLCSFVERHGVDHPRPSLAAMPTLTRQASCEFAIRPFLENHLELTRSHLRTWVHDQNEAVRRLASEGTRPLLPWGPRVRALTDDPAIGIELLTELRHDPSETVRRSVANHLNDLTKLHPDLVIEVVRSWDDPDHPVDPGMVRHALRTLVKQGDPAALELLGFTTDPAIDIVEFSCDPPKVEVGGHIELTAELRSTSDADQHLVVDFVMHHVTASGATSPKVFKWTSIRLPPGEAARLTKRRRIEQASTRTYHSGRHRIELQVAGRALAETAFDLAVG